MAKKVVIRKLLLSADVGARRIDHVEVREITFEPGQKSPRHLHACPVVGFIVDGEVCFQIEGQVEQALRRGEAFFEPAETPIARFDNASDKDGIK